MKIIIPKNISAKKLRKISLFSKNSGLYIYYDFIGTSELKVNLSKKILTIGDQQNRSTNLNADMTGWALQNEEPFKTLVDIAKNKVAEVSDIFFNRPDIEWVIKSCWGARYGKGDSALLHDHYPATWSLVYYVETPKGSSFLEFPGSSIAIKPSNGLLLIFPGNIEHQVSKSVIEKNRIIVSMNFYNKF